MSQTAVEVQSPKGLSEAAKNHLSRIMRKAAAGLDRAAKPAIDAWVWAMTHGFKGYRPTLKQAGVEPTGQMQACYTIARAVVETETALDDIIEVAGTEGLKSLAKAASDLLREHGLVATKGKTRTDLEIAAKVVESIVKLVTNLEAPRGARHKSNPGFPKPGDVPMFNVRECVENAIAGRQVNVVLLADVAAQAVPALAEAQVTNGGGH